MKLAKIKLYSLVVCPLQISDNPNRIACAILQVQFFPHSHIFERYATTPIMRVQDHDSQTSKLPRNLVVNFAILGREFGSISGVRQIFAEDGPISRNSAFWVIRANILPHSRPLTRTAIFALTERDASRCEGLVRGKFVPDQLGEDAVGVGIVVPSQRMSENEGFVRCPIVIVKGSRVSHATFELHFGNGSD